MNTARRMLVCLAVAIGAGILGIAQTSAERFLMGGLSAIVGAVGCVAAYRFHQKQLEEELPGSTQAKRVLAARLGVVIPSWLLVCVGVLLYCLLQGLRPPK